MSVHNQPSLSFPSPSMSLLPHSVIPSALYLLSSSPSHPPFSSLFLFIFLRPSPSFVPFLSVPLPPYSSLAPSPIHHASTAVSDEHISQGLANEVPLLCHHSEITNLSLSLFPPSSFTSSLIYSFLPFALLPSSLHLYGIVQNSN